MLKEIITLRRTKDDSNNQTKVLTILWIFSVNAHAVCTIKYKETSNAKL
jgi:hypothetical protein